MNGQHHGLSALRREQSVLNRNSPELSDRKPVLKDLNPNRALNGLNRSRGWCSVRNSPLHGPSGRRRSEEEEAIKEGAIVEIAVGEDEDAIDVDEIKKPRRQIFRYTLTCNLRGKDETLYVGIGSCVSGWFRWLYEGER